MSAAWRQTIVVSGLQGEAPYTLYCEPEGATHEVGPGDVLTITFSGDQQHGFELSHVAGGVVLYRLGNSEVVIADERIRPLRW